MNKTDALSWAPLATRLRPQNLSEFVGQTHLLAERAPLKQSLTMNRLHSMILWGPPGTGKTTLAHLIAAHFDAELIALSAVMAGVKDIREACDRAREHQKPTLVFIDEIHRFNKSQQDGLLPHVESGLITLIGATTENPSFALNNALLSRARVYVLQGLAPADIMVLLNRALSSPLGIAREIIIHDDALQAMAKTCDGDARRALNWLEIAVDLTPEGETLTLDRLQQVMTAQPLRFDKQGDDFYDQISALHKSVRGSDPDAALYWLARMLVSGVDPLYLCRRVVRMASEDIGNADPRALEIAINAWHAMERLGSPEGELALAQAVVFLSCAAKSNAVYKAFNEAMAFAEKSGSQPVPLHLRNAPTSLMKDLDYGKHYRYPHDEPNGYAAGVNYFPEKVKAQHFYRPVDRGLEIQIKEKLKALLS